MPELPEVEVVRRGLAPYVSGRRITAVDVMHERAVRRHVGGGGDFVAALRGRRLERVSRRGKYLWLPMDDGHALVGHLGMSGQLLLPPDDQPDERHLRVRLVLEGADRELRFVDQRTFGGLYVDELVPDDGSGHLPLSIAHIARDPLDPLFDDAAFVVRLRSRDMGVKRALLDQALISGVGNIYADEALWRARLPDDYPTGSLSTRRARELLEHVRCVMIEALAEGGTSFDDLYVDVNGSSGYFDRSLQAYGREGEPCRRCGRAIVREAFMNRSSHRCPRCQPRPRTPRRRG